MHQHSSHRPQNHSGRKWKIFSHQTWHKSELRYNSHFLVKF
jgi:hypothetical protein